MNLLALTMTIETKLLSSREVTQWKKLGRLNSRRLLSYRSIRIASDTKL